MHLGEVGHRDGLPLSPLLDAAREATLESGLRLEVDLSSCRHWVQYTLEPAADQSASHCGGDSSVLSMACL